MRYRVLSATGDYVFGRGVSEFLVNSPQTVGQAIVTRLRLWTGQWWLDTNEGIDWLGGVLGKGTQPIYDQVIKERILGTEGVLRISEYASYLDDLRRLSVDVVVDTIYGQVGVRAVAPINTPGILDVNFVLDVSTLG